jgi:NADH-quinone oxidoreductase subunit J
MQQFLTSPGLQLAIAALFGAVGVYLLLPKPKLRSVTMGTFLALASLAVLGLFLVTRFASPLLTRTGDTDPVGSAMFWVFSSAATLFSFVLLTQRNPARGAIAFAFVILSTCGLFLLLAAPFLMAATIVVYAGAIVVTFLFVLMLSNVRGVSDENDRTREPLLGSLAGFGFLGLILFTLHQSVPSTERDASPIPVLLTTKERAVIEKAFVKADEALKAETADEQNANAKQVRQMVADVFEPTSFGSQVPLVRLDAVKKDPRVEAFLQTQAELTAATTKLDESLLNNSANTKDHLKAVRDKLAVFRGSTDLPARNVANIGVLLYSEYLLAVEMAGTLLLVATIGAVTVANRRKGALS